MIAPPRGPAPARPSLVVHGMSPARGKYGSLVNVRSRRQARRSAGTRSPRGPWRGSGEACGDSLLPRGRLHGSPRCYHRAGAEEVTRSGPPALRRCGRRPHATTANTTIRMAGVSAMTADPNNEHLGEGRADHEANEPERGQTGQPGNQQPDRAGELERADQVSQPLTGSDLREHLDRQLLVEQLGRLIPECTFTGVDVSSAENSSVPLRSRASVGRVGGLPYRPRAAA